MKTYEMVEKLKQEIRALSNKHGVWESRVGKMKADFISLQKYHETIQQAHIDEIKETEDTCAELFELLNAKKQELKNFVKGKKPKAREPKTETNGNGKIVCELCGKEFSPQGFPSHFKKCERIHTLEEEILKLESGD